MWLTALSLSDSPFYPTVPPSIQSEFSECMVEAMFPSLPAPTVVVIWNIKAKLRPSIFHTAFCKQQMNKLYHESGHNLYISISPWPISMLFWMVSGEDVWEPGGFSHMYAHMWVYVCPACMCVSHLCPVCMCVSHFSMSRCVCVQCQQG